MPCLTAPVVPAGTLAGMPQPTLDPGDGLLLRPWLDSDAPALHEAFQDPLIHRWHLRAAESVAEVREWIGEWITDWVEEDSAQWAVVAADGGRLMGRVALRELRLDEGVAEVAYWTTAAARGQGVAARATTALSRWALDDIGLQRLELLHSVANEGSCRVAAKSGFRLEGTKRRSGLHADGWHDMHLHARVRGD
ncbi:GNAT family N-acetyltransferase [Streptomyces sp. NPDC058739]|uniref:GNAT family N-acetyltransferase n=1 Tax=Streptomyces sp. NPDC058739 TaxID=3346618 RepID=UPI00369A57C8